MDMAGSMFFCISFSHQLTQASKHTELSTKAVLGCYNQGQENKTEINFKLTKETPPPSPKETSFSQFWSIKKQENKQNTNAVLKL